MTGVGWSPKWSWKASARLCAGSVEITSVRCPSSAARSAVAAATVVAFYCWFWINNGQTLGMQAWRIKLVTFSGDAPDLRACLLRSLGALLSAACLGLGYLWCLFDRHGRYWHDYLSGTELILLPKRDKKKKS